LQPRGTSTKSWFFKAFAGEQDNSWLIMTNGDHVIGLFQGMPQRNKMTFNPAGTSAPALSSTDVRELERQVKAQGITPVTQADETSAWPGNFIMADPDGIPVLIDQYV
jgi:hypothetical protein